MYTDIQNDNGCHGVINGKVSKKNCRYTSIYSDSKIMKWCDYVVVRHSKSIAHTKNLLRCIVFMPVLESMS